MVKIGTWQNMDRQSHRIEYINYNRNMWIGIFESITTIQWNTREVTKKWFVGVVNNQVAYFSNEDELSPVTAQFDTKGAALKYAIKIMKNNL